MFKFKNISGEDMGIIVEEEDNFLKKAGLRYDKTEIDGKNGATFQEKGYGVVDSHIKIQLLDIEKLDKIFSWLNGVGILEYKGRISKTRFYSDVLPNRVSCIKVMEVPFIRNPFWTKKNDYFEIAKEIIINEGSIYSEPIIRLEKNISDTVDITINNIRFVYDFKEDSYVEIDCETGVIEYEKNNRDRQLEMGYEFPTLLPGENQIIINSGDAIVKVKRKDRWL